METPKMRDELRQVARYRTKPTEKTSTSSIFYNPGMSGEVEQPAWAFIVNDLVTRIDTLQKSKGRIIVSADDGYLVLSTVVQVPVPPVAKPAKKGR